jgi:hypothetical protein
MPDGTELRFTHDWGDSIQTTCAKLSGDTSFYLAPEGHLSFSGSLDPAISKSKIFDTGETKLGWVWFFHHGESRAHNGVYAEIRCRVYRYDPINEVRTA